MLLDWPWCPSQCLWSEADCRSGVAQFTDHCCWCYFLFPRYFQRVVHSVIYTNGAVIATALKCPVCHLLCLFFTADLLLVNTFIKFCVLPEVGINKVCSLILLLLLPFIFGVSVLLAHFCVLSLSPLYASTLHPKAYHTNPELVDFRSCSRLRAADSLPNWSSSNWFWLLI